MPTTLSLTTNARLTYTLTDTPALGALAESVELRTARTITNGTGPNQANVAWRDRVTIPANEAYVLDLTALGANAFGFGGEIRVDTLKEFFVVNTETAAGREVLVGAIGPGDVTGYAARVNRGGDFRVADYADGWPVTSGAELVTIANATANAATVEIGVVGVGQIVDT